VIIVEGPDGAGKTKLVERIYGDFGLQVSPKVVDSDTNAMVDLKQWTDENLAGGFQPMIFDRHRLVSEPIYSAVMHKRPDQNFWDPDWLIPAIHCLRLSVKPVMVFCLPPWEEVWKNTVNDPNNQIIFPHIQKIYNAYIAAYANWGTEALRWDYCHPDREEHYGRIHSRIQFALKTRTELRDRRH
jgi:hypothetical protein